MKFSLNLAQYYSNVDLKSLDTDDVVRKLGLQLGAIESVERYADKYTGVVVAKIVSCEKHPDADKLSLCMIDDGGVTQAVERNENGYVQVVCGAPNVRDGIYVAWIPPKAVVPSSYGDAEPFVLEARELRGKVSNGMLASKKELAMGEDHEGILEISALDVDEELLSPGVDFSKLYGLDDVVIDCENKMFTHRPDCFGNMGIARELSGIYGMKYASPEWYKQHIDFDQANELEMTVSNNVKELVPRFSVIVMNNVVVEPSPQWMQGFLLRSGIKPINNVVDITNYVMHFLGQPLHAFDYDKLQQYSDVPSLSPRMAHQGEKLQLLNGKEIELDTNDIVISTDAAPVALAGIMGGSETEVDENTKSIVIECANFDMYAIRRSSMRHGLFTDAVTRFNKGQSPLQNLAALSYVTKLMSSYASASQASPLYDIASFDTSADNLNHVEVSAEFINSRLGTDLSADTMKQLLENVEFKVELAASQPQPEPSTSTLKITVPFWRMDIAIKEDIVEEIGRLHGYQKIDATLPARSSRPAPKNAMREFKKALRDTMTKYGANEVPTYSFVHGDLLKNTGTDPDKWAYHVRNALSPDLQYYRTSLTPSLLAKVHANLKAQAGSDANEFALFEIGKAHVKDHMEETPEENLPKQMRRIACVLAADPKTAKKYDSSAYYQAKKYVDELTNGQASYKQLESTDSPVTSVYQLGRSAVVTMGNKDEIIGVIGEYNKKARKSLKLPEYCAGFEIDLDLLKENLFPKTYEQLSQYPSTSQDVTYEVPLGMDWSTLNGYVHGGLIKAEKENGYKTAIEPLDIFQPESIEKKRISFRITASHPNKTLKTAELTALLDTITGTISEELHATRI